MKEEILNLRKEGLLYTEIKKKLKCSMSIISYHCRKNDLCDPNKFRTPNSEEIKEMQEFYDSGKTLKDVSIKFGWHKQTISKYITVRSVKKLSDNELKKRRSKSVVSWRKKTKIKLIEYKGGKCMFCGYKKCIEALDFHHINPKEKDFTISGKSWGFDRLKKESDKCVLVCNRCHTEIHSGLISVDFKI